jgi:predicted ATP-grasp superfamily ATP-dependent carboligase
MLVVKIGGYPLSHQGLAAVRTMGRVGVPAYTITEDRFTPQAVSRYLKGRFVMPTTGAEAADALVAEMLTIGRRLPAAAVALPTDDEAAILLAEHQPELAPFFIQPAVRPDLPRRLASKRGLAALCLEHGVATPRTLDPRDAANLRIAAAALGYPIVVKNADPWTRLRAPAVPSTTMVATDEELAALGAGWPDPPNVVFQEHIPSEVSEDWIYHGYFSATAGCLASFTGIKVRSWPPIAGVTSLGRAIRNDRLAAESERFCTALGYRGIVDLDWRYDARDDRYKIVDFNPRAGANLRMFVDDRGLDVVRTMHLDLTGRSVAAGRAVEGRGLVVEHLDLPSRIASRRRRSARPRRVIDGPVELAWFASDDVVPFLAMVPRVAGMVAAKVVRAVLRGVLAGRGSKTYGN